MSPTFPLAFPQIDRHSDPQRKPSPLGVCAFWIDFEPEKGNFYPFPRGRYGCNPQRAVVQYCTLTNNK